MFSSQNFNQVESHQSVMEELFLLLSSNKTEKLVGFAPYFQST